MVAFFLFILLSSALGATQTGDFDILGIEERRILPDKTKSGQKIVKEVSEHAYLLTGKYSSIGEKAGADINIELIKRKSNESTRDFFYLKDNAYIAFFLPAFQLNIGRKIFSQDKRILQGHKDGIEGISIEKQFGAFFKASFHIYDHYRGFPLLEKNLILTQSGQGSEDGKRSRHGLSFEFERNGLFSTVRFLYLNMGSWGNFSNDEKKNNLKGIGDGDFVYNSEFQIGKKWESFILQASVIFSRGIDKATTNPVRQEKSIPISGELFLLNALWKGEITSLRFEAFLPDSDKTNPQGEILETGFLGMGTNPVNSVLISQALNFYPSQWVTPFGMEKADSFALGRKNSLYLRSDFSVSFLESVISFEAEKIFPRSDRKNDTGNISLQKRDYSKESLTALTLAVQSDKREESFFFLKLSCSKLFSPKETGLSSTFVYFQAGIRFL